MVPAAIVTLKSLVILRRGAGPRRPDLCRDHPKIIGDLHHRRIDPVRIYPFISFDILEKVVESASDLLGLVSPAGRIRPGLKRLGH